jgi:hypothetical protein
MKCSRVLIAVLAVLCLATVSSASVISSTDGLITTSTVTVTAGTYGKMGLPSNSYYQAGLVGNAFGPVKAYAGSYDVSSIIADVQAGNSEIVSAYLVYNDILTTSATVRVVQLAADYTTCTTAGSLVTAGISNGGTTYTALLGTTVVDTAMNATYTGLAQVDISTILASWVAGATNFGLGVSCSTENTVTVSTLPYLVITTQAVPEPVTMGLLLVGGIASLLRRRSRV